MPPTAVAWADVRASNSAIRLFISLLRLGLQMDKRSKRAKGSNPFLGRMHHAAGAWRPGRPCRPNLSRKSGPTRVKFAAFEAALEAMKSNSYDCKKCPGYCCSYPLIEVNKADIARLAKHHELDYETAEERFTYYDKDEKVRGRRKHLL